MRIDKMPESEEKEAGLQMMQADIHMKGAQLGKVWAELFGLLSKYQAELMVKENQIEIAERQLETKKEQYSEVSPLQGLDDIAKVEERLQEKECQLSQCQIELSQMETNLKQVQMDLSTNTDMLDQTRTELLEKQAQCVRCQDNVERSKADVSLKDEQIRVKDSLLTKVQQQLMKENAELKEQYLEEKSLLDVERLTHSQTKMLLERLQVCIV
jgi:chromosome segregation ATPase